MSREERTLIAAALWAVKLALFALSCHPSALGQFQTENTTRRAVETTDGSPADDKGEPSNAAAVHRYALDLRPVVTVYSDDPRRCQACLAFHAWRDAAGERSPFRFELHRGPRPAWLTAYPSFVFGDAAGKRRLYVGWQGVDALVRSYTAANPNWQVQTPEPPAVDDSPDSPPLSVRDSRGGSDLLRSLLQAGGEFSLRPDKPLSVALDDSTTLRVQALTGRVDRGVVTFAAPRPEGTHTVAGIWRVGFTVQSVRLDGDRLAIATNWRTVYLRVEGWK